MSSLARYYSTMRLDRHNRRRAALGWPVLDRESRVVDAARSKLSQRGTIRVLVYG